MSTSLVTAAARRGLYYGWVVVGTLATTETISWGILYYAFAAFLVPMQRELGWSTAALTGAYSLALLVSGLAAIPVGRWIDRRGPRLLMTLGSIGGALLLLAWSRTGSLPAFYLLWAAMGLVLAATLYEPAFTVVAVWFRQARSRALLLLTFVAGFASTIFLPVATALIERYGWRQALVILAIFLAVTTIPAHAFILRRRPEDLGLHPDGALPPETARALPDERDGISLRVALHEHAFWWLTAAFFFGTLSSVAVAVHLIPFLLSDGYTPGFAALATGLIGATQVAARVVVTLAGNRVPPVPLTAAVFALQGAAILILLSWQQASGVLLAVILLGAGRGAVTLMRASLIAERYGRTHYGAIGGALALFVSGAAALAPVGAGVAYQVAGGYPLVFAGLAGISGLAALAMVGMWRWG
ncbi:MAG: MFS transporter [Chloroflexota bacterium]|nr:MFS transporter [Chloroflexota bacterium]